LRLEEVRIECGDAIFDIQIRHPFKIPVHRRGGKAAGSPFLEIGVDALRALIKDPPIREHLPIMDETVDPDLESVLTQAEAQLRRYAIIFRHEKERGPEAQALFEVGEKTALVMAFCRINVVIQDERESFPLRPPGPPRRRVSGSLVDGPDVPRVPALIRRDTPSDLDLEPARDERLESVKESE
jgi:hypothetical protein